MSENIKQIACRLKELRDIRELSIDDVAQQFSITAANYAQFESGETDIPVSFLYEAAQFFQVELIELLSGEAPKLHIYQKVAHGKGLPVERSKQYKYHNLAYNFAHKKAEPFLVSVQPSDGEIPTNAHPGQEFNYCLSGRMRIRINNQDVFLDPGDCIYYDSSYPHGMQAIGGDIAQFIAIII